LNSDYNDLEVILVDNDSIDDSWRIAESSPETRPSVRIIRNETNLGYAKGNNVGALNARGKYLMFLNFDTIVDSKWLTEIVESMEENPMLAIVQCKVLLMDNHATIDNVGHYIDRLGLTYFIGHLEQDKGQYSNRADIFAAYGATFMIRTELFRKLGGFDPDFFLLFEETDLCWRAQIAGYAVAYCPLGKVYHKGGASFSGSRGDYPLTTFLFVRNRLASLLKNYEFGNVVKYVPMNISIMLGVALIDAAKGRAREAVAVIRGIVWNVLNLSETVKKRRTINELRTVSDQIMFARGTIKRFNLTRALGKARDMYR
jgi:GT2 family glycosyltransferase